MPPADVTVPIVECSRQNCFFTNLKECESNNPLFCRNVKLIGKKVKAGQCMFCPYKERDEANTVRHIFTHLENGKHFNYWFSQKCSCTRIQGLVKWDFFGLLMSQYPHLVYGLIVDEIFGRDLFKCGYHGCDNLLSMPQPMLQRHLYSMHLKIYVERDEALECSSSKVDPSVRAVPGCGFPQFHFKSILLQHYAFEHNKVNFVYKQFCLHNNWEWQKLEDRGFFREDSPAESTLCCFQCKVNMRSDYFLLHLDECTKSGVLSSLLGKLGLGVCDSYEKLIESTFPCPSKNCRQELNLSQMFTHWIKRHKLADRKFSKILCDNRIFLYQLDCIDSSFFDELQEGLEIKIVKLVKSGPVTFACPDCSYECPVSKAPDLNLVAMHINKHISNAKIASSFFRQKLVEEFNYSGVGCPYPGCFLADTAVPSSHVTCPTHDMELCVFHLYLKKSLECMQPIAPFLSKKSASLLKHLQKGDYSDLITIPKIEPVEDIDQLVDENPFPLSDDPAEPVEPSVSRKQTRSPGIKFVLPRSADKNHSKFIAQCNKSFKSVILLTSQRVLSYSLFKQFIVFLAKMEVDNRKGIIEEVNAVSGQVDHVMLHDEIYTVPDLFRFSFFLKFWNCYPMLRRLSQHCNASKTLISTCDPMLVVIVMSQFIKDKIPKADIAQFLAIVNEVHFKVGLLSIVEQPAIKEFIACEDIRTEDFFQLAKNHRKYLTCTSCFKFDCYFASLTEAVCHVRMHHTRAQPGCVGCIRCYTPNAMNVTSDEGSIHTFMELMNMHQYSTEHLRMLYSMGHCDSLVQDECFVCGVAHTNCTEPSADAIKHKKLVKVLDFYLYLCSSSKDNINPFSVQTTKFYLFAVKLMLTEHELRACSVEGKN